MLPENTHSLSRILRNATPENLIAFSQIKLRVGENAAISPFYFSGSIFGNPEFTIVDLHRLYLAFDVSFSPDVIGPSATFYNIYFYDQLANLTFTLENHSIGYRTLAPIGFYSQPLTTSSKNVNFSYVDTQGYYIMNFIGLKFTF